MKEGSTAQELFATYVCSYRKDTEDYSITEYALEYCQTDEDGEFVSGSDYELAKTE